MTGDRTVRAIPRVAELIANADALLITSGAGMGVDSGLPDFRGGNGFWGAYPALANLDISFEQMAQPAWFDEKPDMAWAFYGHRQQLYRETKPHDGYRMLLEWAQAMPAGYFTVTSNVDGHFHYAGYPAEQILEQHGNIHRYQCCSPCCRTIWYFNYPERAPHRPPDLQIDLGMLRAFGKLPRCPECGGLARPNVLMFNDDRWLDDVRRIQKSRYLDWLAKVRGRNVVVIECGAGSTIDTIRRLSEEVTERPLTTLVRINPAASEDDASVLSLRMPALEAITRIEGALPEGFRQRVLAAVPEPRRVINFDESEAVSPGTRRRFVSRDLATIKYMRMTSNAYAFRLACGAKVWVEKVDLKRNYLDWRLSADLPRSSHVTTVLEEAREFVRKALHGPEPVVIPPKLYDASSDSPILPALRFAAQARSWERINDVDEGSWMNLIWFAEIDDDKSIKQLVQEALAQVDWKKQATGYSA